ncbi:MAG: RNA methyltransferase [Deltaproteobacteria bacterium]|nr:RNA methyltransferase [Deltaproteobacteria bacterium]
MDLHAAEALVAEHGAHRVMTALGPYLTEARRTRIDHVVSGRVAGVHVAVEAPSDPHNAAAVVRSAEAFGVLGVHVIAAEPRALHARNTTQGAFHWVHTRHHHDLTGFLAEVRRRGMTLAGASMDGSVPVTRLPVDAPLCLLLGNETRGLSQAAREACDVSFHVPMVGMSESLNLSVTAAVSLFEVLRRKRASGERGDLCADDRDRLRACYYLASVDPRMVKAMFVHPPTERTHGC